ILNRKAGKGGRRGSTPTEPGTLRPFAEGRVLDRAGCAAYINPDTAGAESAAVPSRSQPMSTPRASRPGASAPYQPLLQSTSPPLAADILADAQAQRVVLQDFVPLAESLEWELGQEYLKQRGNKAFISDASPVPFVVNNDGTLSRNAADVLFASLQAAEQQGTLEDEIFVLELGIGVGLFARYFLDHFRDLCAEHKRDYCDRLCYIAADRSERMLLDACRHGVFANHPGRYRLRVCDAL